MLECIRLLTACVPGLVNTMLIESSKTGVTHAIWDAVSCRQTWNPRGGFMEEF